MSSVPATKDVSKSRPLDWWVCANAKRGTKTVAPGCEPELGFVKQSISKAWVNEPLASAAELGSSWRPLTPRTCACPVLPDSLANAVIIWLQGKVLPYMATAKVSAKVSLAR